MARPNSNYECRREELIKVAFDLFISQGYDCTTITQIMKTAGLTKAGMYHYFASKEDILDAAIHYGVSREIVRVRDVMKDLCAEDKMLFFIRGNASPDDLFRKLVAVKQAERNSLAAYRIREALIHAYIPVMEEILRDGMEAGLYHTDYLQPTAEYLVLLAKTLVESNLLPPVGPDGQKARLNAFLALMEGWLRPVPEHTKAITKLFEELLVMGQEETETNEAE